jgi:hypothetical protein
MSQLSTQRDNSIAEPPRHRPVPAAGRANARRRRALRVRDGRPQPRTEERGWDRRKASWPWTADMPEGSPFGPGIRAAVAYLHGCRMVGFSV